MPQYSVHFFCDECGEPHPLGVSLPLDDPNFDKRTINDIYAGRDLPPQIVMMQENTTNCPNTGNLTSQKDNAQLFLVATSV